MNDKQISLTFGSVIIFTANKFHSMTLNSEFISFVIMETEFEIKFTNK